MTKGRAREPIPETPTNFFQLMEVVSWVVLAGIVIIAWLTVTQIEFWQKLAATGLVASFIAWVFHWFIPRFGIYRWMYLPLLLGQVLTVGLGFYVVYPYDISNFFVVVIGVTAIIAEWQMVFLGVVLSTAMNILVRLVRAEPSTDLIVSVGFDFLVMAATGYLLVSLAHIARRQLTRMQARNRELSLLLDLNANMVGFLNLQVSLPLLAKKIAVGLPVTLCRICLLGEDGKTLINYGVYPLRSVPASLVIGARSSLDTLPWHRQAIETGAAVIIRADQIAESQSEPERQTLLFDGVQSACLIPFGVDEGMLGVVALAEQRSWEREDFDQRKLDLLKTIGSQLAIVVQNSQMHEVMRKQAERFLVLNEVAHAIGSTIEMDELLELIYQQLSQVISTDTYYVALYDPVEETVDIRILIDVGQRFASQKIPVRTGLVSLVIRNRRAMMFSHLSAERGSLPIEPLTLGHARSSESWLGVPLMSGENLLGLLVVASYTPFAFTDEDRRMMSNLAEQVVLALDNAHHHADVERQSRCDSLTGASNHGYFIEQLRLAVKNSQENNRPVTLIMLDIDFFKQYNDTFGHTVGDAVLQATVQAIQSHIKKTDAVGRWGGEEFGIVLPGATTEDARQVAERIRRTMASLRLKGTQGQSVPAPTVSQGIATFPNQVISADALVVEADRTLYRAKANGRDQVAVARDLAQ